MDRNSAIKRAIGDCIRQDVLRDFLKEHGSEIHNMLLSGWNWDDAKRVWQREVNYNLADIENMLKARVEG